MLPLRIFGPDHSLRSRLPLPILACFLVLSGCEAPVCSVPPSITGQPASQTIAAGQPALFSVAAAGTPSVTYQWLKNGSPIEGATKGSYMTPAATAADSGATFTVTVTNSLGTVTSLPGYLTVNSSSPQNVRYVSPTGNDSNSGTIEQPYQTIQHCASTVAAGWTCLVRAGTYRETVVPNSGVTIGAYNLEAVVVDGSDPITGWTLDHDSIYKTNVVLNSDDTNQLFVGSEMMTEARWPNGDNLFDVNWATAQSGTDSGRVVDGNLPVMNWTGATIHLWSGSDPFGHQTGKVTGSTSGAITIDVGQSGTCPAICPTKGGYYYLFGILGALDVEKEWFYDSNAGTLYFMAPGKSDPNTLDVRAKRRQYAFDLSGKSNVTIRGITVFASTIMMDPNSFGNTLDRINVQYPSHFTSLPKASWDSDGSGFSIIQVHLHDSGIIVNGTGNVLRNSTVSYSAGAGVALEGDNNTLINNWIHHVDYIGDYTSGIDLDGNGNAIQYNTIQNAGRQGILIDEVDDEDISYNNLSNSMLLSSDGGEIYACCYQDASNFRIHHNWIHDTMAVVKGVATQNPLSGIDIDNGSSGFEVDQNVFWYNRYLNILVNNAGVGSSVMNDIKNNSIPDDFPQGRIQVDNLGSCAPVRISANRIAVHLKDDFNGSACYAASNSSGVAGAIDMTTSTGVGCNFDGCGTNGPPVFYSNGSVSACPVSVFAK